MAIDKIDNIYEFYKNGQLKRVRHYKSARRCGEWMWWYENGQLERIICYNEKGKVLKEKEYDKDGVEVGELQRTFENGKLRYEKITRAEKYREYKEERIWHDNGKLASEDFHDGDYKTQLLWNTRGRLICEVHYINEKKNGAERLVIEGDEYIFYWKNEKPEGEMERAIEMIADMEEEAEKQIKQTKRLYKI